MNTIKFALLGTAAIAAVSVSAQASTASDVAALRAQVEALSAQVAAAQTSADLPAGYQFVTTSMQPSLLDPTRKAFTLAIMPTADAPASTVIQWTGFVRTALVFKNTNYDALVDDSVAFVKAAASQNHILTRGELTVTGKTDTAVGEVGATMTLRTDFDANNNIPVNMPTAKGWWKMTPNLSLQAGSYGMVGGIGGYGDDKLNALYTDGTPNSSGTPGDTTQFDLVYADGPMSFAIGVGHYAGTTPKYTFDTTTLTTKQVSYSDYAFGANAEFKGDSLAAKVGGWIHNEDYQAGVGVTASMDMFTLSAAAHIGKDGHHTFTTLTPTGSDFEVMDATYWGASLFAGASLSDAIKAEIGVGYSAYTGTPSFPANTASASSTQLGVAGGIYYSPVSQLTIGAEASWNKYNTTVNELAPTVVDSADTTAVAVDLVTVFKF